MVKVIKKLGITPRVAVMSLGRKEDKGRNDAVDKSLEEAESLVVYAKENGIVDSIYNTGILLEDIDRVNANCVLAPAGYIGNIMYRCLVHLGCGRSYGGYICGIPDSFIDTSR